MDRSLICVHCGRTVGLETRAAPVGRPLVAHLTDLHRELLEAFEGGPRWADLLEHFRVVPLRFLSSPPVVRA